MCGIDYNQFLSICCQECGDLWWTDRCFKCNTYLCEKCINVVTYTRPGQQVNGVETSPLHNSIVKRVLCSKCFKEFDPFDRDV